MMYLKRLSLALAIAATVAPASHAQYTQTLPEFNAGVNGPFPSAPMAVGTFTGLPGSGITGATISGFFGNSVAPNSAPSSIYLNSILVAECATDAACVFSQSPTPWSYTFTAADLASFSGTTADLTATQNGCCIIRLGETTLNVTYGTIVTPEPATLGLLVTGLVGIFGVARRKTLVRGT